MSRLKVNTISALSNDLLNVESNIELGTSLEPKALDVYGNIIARDDITGEQNLILSNASAVHEINGFANFNNDVHVKNSTDIILDVNKVTQNVIVGKGYDTDDVKLNIFTNKIATPIFKISTQQYDADKTFDNPNELILQFSKLQAYVVGETSSVRTYFDYTVLADSIYIIEAVMMFKYFTYSPTVLQALAFRKITNAFSTNSSGVITKTTTSDKDLFSMFTDQEKQFKGSNVVGAGNMPGQSPNYLDWAPVFETSTAYHVMIKSALPYALMANSKFFCTGQLKITKISGTGV
jgi:hypothetical protein